MVEKKKLPIAYLTFDVEANGPAPHVNSMLGFGAALITPKKKILAKWEYHLLDFPRSKPDDDTMEWWSTQKEAWDHIMTNRQEPSEVFQEFGLAIEKWKEEYTIIVITWPSAYHWQWFNVYFHKYFKSNPLGYSAKCIGSYLCGLANANAKNPHADDEFIKQFQEPGFIHNHKPLDDALYQGMAMMNAFESAERKQQRSSAWCLIYAIVAVIVISIVPIGMVVMKMIKNKEN
jgi:hypothetical protein